MRMQPKSDVTLSLDMYICEYRGGWYHNGFSTNVPEGWDAPVGPFKTYDMAAKNFMKWMKAYYIDAFKEDELKNVKKAKKSKK